jgi:hypothetical protein
MKIELDYDQIDYVIVSALKEQLEDYEIALQRAVEGHPRGYYSSDSDIEVLELGKDISALMRVLEIWTPINNDNGNTHFQDTGYYAGKPVY